MKSSLSVRITAGVLVVVAAVLIGGGFLIVRVTEQRDARDAGGELQRIAGNLTPWIAGTLGIGRPANSPGDAVPAQLLDAHGQPIALNAAPNPPPPPPGAPNPAAATPSTESAAAGTLGWSLSVTPSPRAGIRRALSVRSLSYVP
jgi:hypothetical protein